LAQMEGIMHSLMTSLTIISLEDYSTETLMLMILCNLDRIKLNRLSLSNKDSNSLKCNLNNLKSFIKCRFRIIYLLVIHFILSFHHDWIDRRLRVYDRNRLL
jgi:hypothetical protein